MHYDLPVQVLGLFGPDRLDRRDAARYKKKGEKDSRRGKPVGREEKSSQGRVFLETAVSP